MKTAEGLMIGELSGRTGVNSETIRYYERIGIMPKPDRSAGGYRLYRAEHVRRLGFIRRGRELGFALEELRVLLELVDGHAYTCAEVHAMTLEHLSAIRGKIADLKRLERVMKVMAAQCRRDRIPNCPVVDALFAAGPVGKQRSTSHRHRTP